MWGSMENGGFWEVGRRLQQEDLGGEIRGKVGGENVVVRVYLQ